MPIYTYECTNGHRWDEQRTFSEFDAYSLGPCPEGEALGKRVWNPGDMRPVFKGRGWARKDHKDASKP